MVGNKNHFLLAMFCNEQVIYRHQLSISLRNKIVATAGGIYTMRTSMSDLRYGG
jgi:hypothetical protein